MFLRLRKESVTQSVISVTCRLSKINFKYHFPNDEVIFASFFMVPQHFSEHFKNRSSVFRSDLHPTQNFFFFFFSLKLIKIPLLHVNKEFRLDSV